MNILQDHSKELLRASLIQQLSAYSQNEDEFLRHVVDLAGTQGEKIYPVLLNILTQLDFKEDEARSIWQGVVRHRQQMADAMARPVNLTTAICDYMLTVRRELIHPKVVELNLFEETSRYSKCDSLTGLYTQGFMRDTLAKDIVDINTDRRRRPNGHLKDRRGIEGIRINPIDVGCPWHEPFTGTLADFRVEMLYLNGRVALVVCRVDGGQRVEISLANDKRGVMPA